MKNNFVAEIIVSTILIVLALLLLNPMDFWMPQPAHMILIAILAILFLLFAGFVWQEKALDERELQNRNNAGRTAYLSGVTVLIAGVAVQSLNHSLDPWLVLSLIAMVFAKMVVQIYNKVRS